jgi:hypothetical protein
MPCRATDQLALTMTVAVARRFTRATIIAAAPQKRVQFLLENRLDGGADIFSQTILDRIIARFIGQ